MKKEFIDRVIREGSVDTRDYRYVADVLPDGIQIRRLHLSDLDTTAALDSWELVSTIK